MADHLIDADYVSLARENPDRPFTLSHGRLLKGESSPPSIDLFLDSQSRRILANNPDRHILCVYNSKDPNPTWRRIALLNPSLAPIVDDILEKSARWKSHPEERPPFFSSFLGNNDPQIATLAHLEVARAPYSEIRDLADSVPVTEVRSFLADFRMTEWHALYILLLAQSDESMDHERITKAVRSNADYSITLQTAAWATAYIEVKEQDAIDYFDKHYLTNPDRSRDEIKSILAALSVHGTNGHIHLRDRIVESYQALATMHPGLLPTITVDLKEWQRWELTETVSSILASAPESYDLESTLQLRSYLRDASQNRDSTSKPKDSKHPAIWIVATLLFLPILIKLLGARKKESEAPS